MSETNDDTAEHARLKAESIALAATLHTIISESADPEVIRIALAGLQGTEIGRAYLDANRIQY